MHHRLEDVTSHLPIAAAGIMGLVSQDPRGYSLIAFSGMVSFVFYLAKRWIERRDRREMQDLRDRLADLEHRIPLALPEPPGKEL